MKGRRIEKMEKFIIVLAWKAEDFKVIKPGQSDIGIPAKIQKIEIGKSAIWLDRGSNEDLEKANSYANRPESIGGIPGTKVFTYPLSEKNPLERARKDILK
jgi:hypothetical protein